MAPAPVRDPLSAALITRTTPNVRDTRTQHSLRSIRPIHDLPPCYAWIASSSAERDPATLAHDTGSAALLLRTCLAARLPRNWSSNFRRLGDSRSIPGCH